MNREEKNSLILVLFIFQFGLFQIFAKLTNVNYFIVFFTIGLLSYSFYINKNYFNIRKYTIIFVVLIIFIIEFIFYKSNRPIIYKTILGFITKSIPGFYLASEDLNNNKIILYSKYVALMNLFLLTPFIIIPEMYDMNYMRFGYAMLPSLLVFIHNIFNEKKYIFWLLLSLITFFQIFIFGSRGAIFALFILLLLLFMFTNKINLNQKYKLLLILIIFAIVLLQFNVLEYIVEFIYYRLEIHNYAVEKFLLMLRQGLFASSSGRDFIYIETLKVFKSNILFGRGIGSVELLVKYRAHNIFLQVLAEHGILGFIILCLAISEIVKTIIKYNKINKEVVNIIYFLFSISFGRLFWSSDIWLRPEFWILIAYIFNMKKNNDRINLTNNIEYEDKNEH